MRYIIIKNYYINCNQQFSRRRGQTTMFQDNYCRKGSAKFMVTVATHSVPARTASRLPQGVTIARGAMKHRNFMRVSCDQRCTSIFS